MNEEGQQTPSIPAAPQDNPTTVQQPVNPAPSSPVLEQSPVPQSSANSINIIEVSGLAVAILLLVGIFSGSVLTAQIALFIFAGIGIFTVIKELSKDKVTRNTAPTSPSATQQLSANELQAKAQIKAPTSGKNILKVASLTILIILGAIFVLPALGMFLLIILFLILGGGQSSG